MTTMDDLAAFIAARLSEDEAMAKRNSDGRGLADGFPDYRTYSGPDQLAADEYIDHFSPARVLREVTAKRDVLVIHHLQIIRQEATPFNPYTGEPNEPAYDGNCETCGWFNPGHGGCPTLRAIAATWSDHPDYRPEWAPGDAS